MSVELRRAAAARELACGPGGSCQNGKNELASLWREERERTEKKKDIMVIKREIRIDH